MELATRDNARAFVEQRRSSPQCGHERCARLHRQGDAAFAIKANRGAGGSFESACAKRLKFGKLSACAFLCISATAELCAAAEAPLPAATSFAYFNSHPVTPLPASVIADLMRTDGRDSSEADAFDEPHETRVDVRIGAPRPMSRSSMCSAVASVARANGLPVPFFANLIWQESSFNARTISSAGAQGVAQFMPQTAKEYGLINPFEPIHALFAAGRFLRKLHAQFGNLGLAAAAYNAGPGRVSEWMAKRRTLPDETRNYVARITGNAAEQWTSRAFVSNPDATLMPAKAPCTEVAEDVAAQAKVVQEAKLAAAAAAIAAAATGLPASRKGRAPDAVRTAVKPVKGQTAQVAAAKKPAAAPIKLADRIAPDKSADRMSRVVSQKPGKSSVGKSAAVKTVQKAAPGRMSQKRTRVASAR